MPISGSRRDAACRQDPDVLFLDVVVPGRSGIDALPDLLGAAPRPRFSCFSMLDVVRLRPGHRSPAGASG